MFFYYKKVANPTIKEMKYLLLSKEEEEPTTPIDKEISDITKKQETTDPF